METKKADRKISVFIPTKAKGDNACSRQKSIVIKRQQSLAIQRNVKEKYKICRIKTSRTESNPLKKLYLAINWADG